MQETRHLAVTRPRDASNQDEDGDPLVTSRAVEFREFNDDARCISCNRLGRPCHVREGLDSCIQCSVTASAHDCVFIRKVVRQERLTWFTWPELTGFTNHPYKNGREHLQPQQYAPIHAYQEPPRPLAYSQPYPPPAHPPETNHVERTWSSYQHPPQQGPATQQLPVYNGQMPPPKRQRTDLYDGQDVFAHTRQSSLQAAVPPPGWQSPRRPEFHLPEIRPHEAASAQRKIEEPVHLKEERPSSAPHERNPKTLDLKPPSAPPSAIKRKLEAEHAENVVALPHRCSKCDSSFKTPAELKKHFARHEPQYFCNIPGCSRGRDGFTTKNDLDRHRKTMHKILSPNDRFWKCFYPDCAKTEKVWPRLDNFKAHIVRMHGTEYVQENVAKAEEWWDAQKTPMLGRSPETTHDLVAIEPKPLNEPSRLGVTNLLADPPVEHANGRRRHLSAEGRQEAAQVREMGACLRCALLKEKCDDNKVCHRCNMYANKHFNGMLICRRGNIADFLVPIIPLWEHLPRPEEHTKGWNLRSSSAGLRFTSFSELLERTDYPPELQAYALRKTAFTIALFKAMDEVIYAHGPNSHSQMNTEYQAEVDALRQFRDVCCLIFECVVDVLDCTPPAAKDTDLREKLQRTTLELREWFDEVDNAVFDWKSRQVDLNQQNPWKKWNLLFAICSMLVMERLTVMLTRSWAFVAEGRLVESSDDEAADTLCALLEFKFVRQSPAQHHFVSMLLEDRHESTQGKVTSVLEEQPLTHRAGLRESMKFLREAKGFETWKWLYEQFGDLGSDTEDLPGRNDDRMSDDSDTIQVEDTGTVKSRKVSDASSEAPSPKSGAKVNGDEPMTNGNGKEENGSRDVQKKSSSPEKMEE